MVLTALRARGVFFPKAGFKLSLITSDIVNMVYEPRIKLQLKINNCSIYHGGRSEGPSLGKKQKKRKKKDEKEKRKKDEKEKRKDGGQKDGRKKTVSEKKSRSNPEQRR